MHLMIIITDLAIYIYRVDAGTHYDYLTGNQVEMKTSNVTAIIPHSYVIMYLAS